MVLRTLSQARAWRPAVVARLARTLGVIDNFMPTYKRTAVTSKEGINYVRSVVESGGSLFIKIEQENDLGIDALFEFIRDERPLNKQIAVQIKSGASYYSADSEECAFPTGDHRVYWSSHPLPVFGIVYVPARQAAFWVNLKSYLKGNPQATTVRFTATQANRFASDTFASLFLPAILGEIPQLTYEEAVRLADSHRPSETYLGLLVLFRRFPGDKAVWDRLLHLFKTLPVEDIPPVWVYWLAHIPGHGDILYYGKTPTPEVKEYVRKQFALFGYAEVVKLLAMIDPENQIGRGTIGQSVEAIVSSLPGSAAVLRRVIATDDLPLDLRESAALILAMNEGIDAEPDLLQLQKAGSWYAGEMLQYLKDHGSINPYA